MKKQLLLCMALIISLLQTYASNEWISLSNEETGTENVNLVSSNVSNSVVDFHLSGFWKNRVTTPHGKAFIISSENATPLLIEGAPDIPKLTASLIIPDLAHMEVEVLSSTYEDFHNIEIAPSKGNLTRDIDPSTVPFTYGKQYDTDQFFPGKLAGLRDPYIVRDYRGQTVIVYPFQYNPVSKTLRVYSHIRLKVTEAGPNGANPLHRSKALDKVEIEFNKIYAKQFLNYDNVKYTPVDEEGVMLIISYGSFMDEMAPYVNWKNIIGRPTEIVDVATIGNSSAIKSYIANYYNTHDLAYVLLVGDAAQVPSSYASGDSDNDYTYVVGGDHYPDLFIGRFSAENESHVETMVQRTIEYEQNPYTGTDWFTKNMGIASSQGPGDDNEYDYEHVRNMQTDLENYTYTYSYELFDGSQGGNDAPGNPTPSMVGNDINSGSSVILYTGHGSTTSWGSSGFSNSDINSLTNNDMLPFIWSVACVNGNFVNSTCFAEAWLRATNNGQPSGAVATLMSTINQSWNPPMEGQDEMVDILVESYANNIKRTFGGISMNGCMKMNDTYGSGGNSMTDTWTLFGDPSLMVRTDVPQAITANHNNVVFLGATQFTVNCPVQDALVSLTVNNQIIGTGNINGGNVTISFDPLTTIDTMKVAITAYNHIPYLADVPIIPASGPYVTLDSYLADDSNGNNNGQVDFNEDIMLDITLENVGSATANNVNATLITSDPYVNITDNYQDFGNIGAGATTTQAGAFAFTVADDIPDQHMINFELEINGTSDDTWTSYFNITANAPDLALDGITIDDAAGGDGNGRLDPGETADIIFGNINNGNSTSPVASATLATTSPYLTVNTGNANIGTIAPGAVDNASFNVTVDPGAPIGTSVDLIYDLAAGNYGFGDTYYETIGLVLEDWETGDFTEFFWQFDGSADWVIDPADPYEGTYCAKSGDISDSQTSELFLALNISQAGTISFWKKVSSEANYDYFRFYIDGNEQDSWSGTVGWSQETYNVTAGTHTFRWVYDKDYTVSSGSDCAWVDYIVFPPVAPPAPDITVDPLNIDFGNVFVGDVQTLQFTIENSGTDLLNGTITTPNGFTVAAATKGNENPKDLKNSINYTVYPGVTESFDLSFSPTAVQSYSGDVLITHNASGGDILISVMGAGINGLPLPYSEDFEEGGSMPYGWVDETGDDFDWTVNSGGTPSYSTGPSGDHTTGSGFYIYTESSSPNYPGKHAYIQTPLFDIGNNYDVEMRVWYHMYGSGMGTLHVDAFSGGSWQNDIISPISGDQGDQWHELTVDLSSYTGTLKLRFRGITGSSYTSDMALDDFTMQHVVTNPVIVVNPASLDFGDVFVGGNETMPFTIENTGVGGLTGDITTPSGYTVAEAKSYSVFSGWKELEPTDNTINYSVPAGTSVSFDLTFEPVSAQTYSGDVEITSNDPNNPLVLLPVTGNGTLPPDIAVNPTSFSVTLPPDDATTELLNITNSGASDLDFNISIDDPSAGLIPQQVPDELQKALDQRELVNGGNELEQIAGKEVPVLPGINYYGDGENKAEEVFGSWSSTWSGSNRDRGNIFHVTTSTTLQEVRFYLNISTSTQLYFAVYEGAASTGNFSLIDQVHIPSSGTGEGWYSSGALDVTLTAGNYYYICTSWEGTATYGRGDDAVPIAASFGELITGVPSTTAGFPPASGITSNHSGFSPYYQTIVTGSYTPPWLSVTPASGTVSGGQSFTVDVEFNSNGLSEGVYTKNLLVNSNDPDQPVITIPVTLTVSSGITLDLTVYLEGPFNGSTMNTDLYGTAFFPVGQPYNIDPWYYTGSETIGSQPIPDVVDWVLVELREAPGDASTATGSTMISRQAALLLADGSIVGTDGTSLLNFNVTINDNLYAVVWHRNHLGILSNYALTESGGVYSYDFSSDMDMVYGQLLGHKELATGICGMIGGDGNCDSQISNADKNEAWDPQAGSSGYLSGDFNLDSNVDNADKNIIWVPNSGNGSQVPDNIPEKGYTCQVPK